MPGQTWRQDGWEGADEEEGHQDHSDGATLVLDHAHLGNRRLSVVTDHLWALLERQGRESSEYGDYIAVVYV